MSNIKINNCIICKKRIRKWWCKILFLNRSEGSTTTIHIHSSCLKETVRRKLWKNLEKIVKVIGKGQGNGHYELV